jgi:hypothetical protein
VWQLNTWSNDGYQVPFYWYQMWRDDAYVAKRKLRWKEMREANLHSERIMATIDSLANEITSYGAEYRNNLARPRWGERLWPNEYIPTDYADEIAYLKRWIRQRLAWLDARFEFTEVPLPPPPVEPVWGDVNGDREVNVADVNVLIDIILRGKDISEGRSDVNGDGEVGIADVNTLINYILSGPDDV